MENLLKYENIGKLVQVFSVQDANEYIEEGWILLSIQSTDTQGTRFILGKDKLRLTDSY
jgi:hypothetical protein